MYKRQAVSDAVKRLLEEGADGIVCMDDVICSMCLSSLREKKISVPAEIDVYKRQAWTVATEGVKATQKVWFGLYSIDMVGYPVSYTHLKHFRCGAVGKPSLKRARVSRSRPETG